METKRCNRCGLDKPILEFRWKQKSNNIRVNWCRACSKQRRAELYDPEREKQKHSEYAARRRSKVAQGSVLEPPTKACSDCGRSFPIETYRWRDKSQAVRLGRCRDCDREWRKQDYQAKETQYRTRLDKLHAELRAIVEEAKAKPCADCGVKYSPYVMDFDHRDPSQKVTKVSNIARLGSREKLLAEIAKCDLVCANCHRERHFQARKKGCK